MDSTRKTVLMAVFTTTLIAASPTWAQVYDSTGSMPAALDPATVEKYVDSLIIPRAMPRSTKLAVQGGKNFDSYEIAQRQLPAQILPSSYAHPDCNATVDGPCPTQVWSYGAVDFPGTVAEGGSFNYPAFTIEAKWRKPVRVRWDNDLVVSPETCGTPAEQPGDCNFLPHLLPVDQTLHWANPPGTCRDGRTATECKGTDPTTYKGPVPMIVHVHGAETYEWSDGYPEAWYLPAADDVPEGTFTHGAFYETFQAAAEEAYRPATPRGPAPITWGEGFAVFDYPNEQSAATLWYHDHSLGITRLSVYAGPAGFYLLRGGPGDVSAGTLPGPAPALGDPPGTRYYEIPVVIQDRSFFVDGSLAYPDNRAYFEGLSPYGTREEGYLDIPFVPEFARGHKPSDVAPIWLPEFFGNTLVANGKTWPFLDVEPRRYRLRYLNGSQSRFLILRLVTATDPDDADTWQEVPGAFWQIGSEQGFLPAPAQLDEVLLGPAERADVIMDFGSIAVPPGAGLYLVNVAPDEPFGGGVPEVDFEPANPATTGQVMQFLPVALQGRDTSTPPEDLVLPTPMALGAAQNTRQITLNELESETVCVNEEGAGNLAEIACKRPDAEAFGPTEARLGVLDDSGFGVPLKWASATTENVGVGTTEEWEIINLTADAHPIHVHLVQFLVVGRQLLATDEEGVARQPIEPCDRAERDCVRGPEIWETGYKDTVIAYPGEITRVKAQYPLSGLFVWHCHILEHEDNEMMRPYCVGDSAACRQHNSGAGGMGQ